MLRHRPLPFLIIALTTTILVASSAWADDPAPVRLFHIERNTNANIVVYDAMVEAGGDLQKKDPSTSTGCSWPKMAAARA